MASGVVWSTIFLGNLPEIDTNESSTDGENLAPLLTTFGSPSEPLSKQIVDISTNSADGTMTSDNAPSGDTITYDLGGGPVTTAIDTGQFANITITYRDGTTTTQNVGIIQDQLGNVFLLAFDGQTALGAKPIESLTVNGVGSSGSSYSQTGFDSIEFVCFASGTQIDCPGGPLPVEAIRPGDMVDTLDSGPSLVRWTGSRTLVFPGSPESQRPVLIPAGALGRNLPKRDLVVSPQHRMLLHDPAELDVTGVFAIARALTGLPRLRVMTEASSVTYHSLLLDRHEVLIAEGAPAESFYPGPVAMEILAPRDRSRIRAMFLSLLADPIAGYGGLARRQLRRRDAEALVLNGAGLVAWTDPAIGLVGAA